jgi:CRISPR system Cascade subunit CasB
VGKNPGEIPEVWEVTLAELPEGLDYTVLNKKGDYIPSYEAWAIHIALSLYALHQQGKDDVVVSYLNDRGGDQDVRTADGESAKDQKTEKWNRRKYSFGAAVRKLVDPEKINEDATKKRFDEAITAKDIHGLSHHASGLIQLLRAHDPVILLDYADFAVDLYKWQFPGSRNGVMLKWGQGFWTYTGKADMDKGE